MYLTPKQIKAALADARTEGRELLILDTLTALGCTDSPAVRASWNVYTSDGVLVFTGTAGDILAWLRNTDPSCPFAELSPMRRDRLVAAFVSPGRDLLGPLRAHADAHGHEATPVDHVCSIWDDFARHAGWTYLACLVSPAAVAREALSQWSSQHDDGWRDDRNANDY